MQEKIAVLRLLIIHSRMAIAVKSAVYKRNVRSGIRTHAYMSRLRPERSALDRSAILTGCCWCSVHRSMSVINNHVSNY